MTTNPRQVLIAKAIFTGILYGYQEDEWETSERARDNCMNIAADVVRALN